MEPIAVRTYGRGPREVVLLHGGPGAQGSVAGLARDLEGRFHVLEPLQRRGGDAPLTVARHVEDLAAVAPARAVLVGWSWGAMLGLSYAATHSDRVRALVLVGCGTYDPAARAAYHDAMAKRRGPGWDALLARLDATTDPAERTRLFDTLGNLADRAQAYDPLPEEAEALEPDPLGYQETWRDVLRLQEMGAEPAAFRAIEAPVLMLHGREDPHPGPAIRDSLRAHVPHLEYVAFPRCGHVPWRERHARTAFLDVLTRALDGFARLGP